MLDKKKDIGIITFHNAINYGAVLQTYATTHWLESQGYKCEVIDYRCDKIVDSYKILKIYNYSVRGIIAAIIKVPFLLHKSYKFKSFIRNNISVSKKRYDKNSIIEANGEYKVFLSGSDQIWNVELTGSDMNYFLTFVNKEKIRLSYAASTGNTKLSTKLFEKISCELMKFKMISVREQETALFLQESLKEEIYCSLDPVFLLCASDWKKFAKPFYNKKYIFVYSLHECLVYDIAQRLAISLGLEIICIQNDFNSPIKARFIRTAGIEDFLSCIINAEYVVTDSFHGASLGVIFRKNLKIVLKQNKKELNGRLISLAEKFELNETIVSMESPDEKINKVTDYTNKETVINGEIMKAKLFLYSALENTI